jgi:Magnesium chelatase, subunit ChlI
MLARRLTTILPAMRLAEALETTRIHSVAGLTSGRTALVTTRPFRAPHHTIADVGLIGGGQLPTPGEVSLAPHGVLLLDELREFKGHILEVFKMFDACPTSAKIAHSVASEPDHGVSRIPPSSGGSDDLSTYPRSPT